MARRKITEEKTDFSELPDLTDSQLKFCIGIIEGKTATEAWMAAYDASNMKKNSIYVEASRALDHPKISLWIARARKAEMGSARRSLAQHIQRLDRLEQIALETGNVGAAVQAEQLIGKAEGHYVDQVRDVTADPMQLIREIATISPQMAQQLAEENGVEWPHVTEH